MGPDLTDLPDVTLSYIEMYDKLLVHHTPHSGTT